MFHPQTAFVVRLLCTGTIDPTLDDKSLSRPVVRCALPPVVTHWFKRERRPRPLRQT